MGGCAWLGRAEGRTGERGGKERKGDKDIERKGDVIGKEKGIRTYIKAESGTGPIRRQKAGQVQLGNWTCPGKEKGIRTNAVRLSRKSALVRAL